MMIELQGTLFVKDCNPFERCKEVFWQIYRYVLHKNKIWKWKKEREKKERKKDRNIEKERWEDREEKKNFF